MGLGCVWLLNGAITLIAWIAIVTLEKDWGRYHTIFIPIIVMIGPIGLILLIRTSVKKYHSLSKITT